MSRVLIGGQPRFRTAANALAWDSRERAFIRVPAFESGPHTTIAAYLAWREELQTFQRTNQLPYDAMACLLLEQRTLLGGLIELLLEGLFVGDVITPTRERERVDGVGIQRLWIRMD
ncbi:hypothetical protein N9L68_08140 [bacterium]|nr:hypothetical protein [bacterium]